RRKCRSARPGSWSAATPIRCATSVRSTPSPASNGTAAARRCACSAATTCTTTRAIPTTPSCSRSSSRASAPTASALAHSCAMLSLAINNPCLARTGPARNSTFSLPALSKPAAVRQSARNAVLRSRSPMTNMKPLHLASLVLTFAGAVSALPASAQLLSPDAPPPTSAQPAPLPGAQAPASNGLQPLDRIVAVVNDGVILQSQLNQTMGTVAHQIQQSGGQLPPTDVLAKQVLQRLILNQLLVQKARDGGIRVSDDQVDAAVANIAQQNKMSVPQMQAAMQQQGVDYGAFRSQLRDQLLVRALQQQVMQQSAQVSDAEIDNLIASPAFKQGEVHLARILVGLPEGADAKQIAAAQAKAD